MPRPRWWGLAHPDGREMRGEHQFKASAQPPPPPPHACTHYPGWDGVGTPPRRGKHSEKQKIGCGRAACPIEVSSDSPISLTRAGGLREFASSAPCVAIARRGCSGQLLRGVSQIADRRSTPRVASGTANRSTSATAPADKPGETDDADPAQHAARGQQHRQRQRQHGGTSRQTRPDRQHRPGTAHPHAASTPRTAAPARQHRRGPGETLSAARRRWPCARLHLDAGRDASAVRRSVQDRDAGEQAAAARRGDSEGEAVREASQDACRPPRCRCRAATCAGGHAAGQMCPQAKRTKRS